MSGQDWSAIRSWPSPGPHPDACRSESGRRKVHAFDAVAEIWRRAFYFQGEWLWESTGEPVRASHYHHLAPHPGRERGEE